MSQTKTYELYAYGLSDIGCVRKNNEDVWRALVDERFFVLADGMGGYKAGEVAAREAVDALSTLFKQAFHKVDAMNLEEAKYFIKRSVQEVNTLVHLRARARHDWKGMGTTLCCLQLHSQGVICSHVGDSRIYLYRKQRLTQLTRDHSLAKKQSTEGCRHVITKAIGTEPKVTPSVKALDLKLNDIYLLCSDGLTDMVSKETIELILQNEETIELAAHALVSEAKRAGGYDNVSLVLVQVR